MQLDPALLVTAGVLLAGMAATWGALGNRVRMLEKEVAENKALKTSVVNLDAKLEEVRTAQGVRLGTVEKKTDSLIGKFEGFQAGFATGRRSRTSAHGIPTGGEG